MKKPESDVDKFVSILEPEEVKNSCNVCPYFKTEPAMLKKGFDKIEYDRKSCRECVIVLAKKKYTYLYVKEYIESVKSGTFLTKYVKRYIEEVCDFGELLLGVVKVVLIDMVRNGVLEVFRQQGNRIRYKIVSDNATLEKSDFLVRHYGRSGLPTISK
jgi:hypothetical protein